MNSSAIKQIIVIITLGTNTIIKDTKKLVNPFPVSETPSAKHDKTNIDAKSAFVISFQYINISILNA